MATIERLQAGAQSATFFLKGDPAELVVIPASYWVNLPTGKLKNFLNRPYLGNEEISGQEEMVRALAAAGGRLTADDYASSAVPVLFYFDADKYLTIEVTLPLGFASVQVSTTYSASE
jgi:hypothetical protein